MARPPYRGRLQCFIGSKTRAAIIEQLAKHPGHAPYLRELGGAARASLGTLHRELTELQRMGLVRACRREGRCYYSLDTTHPLAGPLVALVAACDEVDRIESEYPPPPRRSVPPDGQG